MNLKDIQIFAEAATLGSFSAVAKSRGTDPSSISRAIAGLEKSLGVALFQRSTRKISLTDAGQLYLSRVVPLIEEIERIGAKARKTTANLSGVLRISAPVALGQKVILPRVTQFRSTYPDLRIDCVFGDASPDLEAQQIDLALRLSPIASGNLVTTQLAETGMRLVASPDHLRTVQPITEPADLAHIDCILRPESEFRTRWLCRDGTGDTVAQPINGPITVGSIGGRYAAVKQGLGAALLPGWLVEADILDGELVHVLPGWEITPNRNEGTIWIAYPARNVLPQKTRVAMDFLRRTI